MSVVRYLFETNAVKVAPEGEMFLTTSGLITPYYVNTHFLCGGEEESTRILSLIDSCKHTPEKIVTAVSDEIIALSNANAIYKEVLKTMQELCAPYLASHNISYISGGERRDWFFSIPLSRLCGLPHLYVYNEGMILDDDARPVTIDQVSNTLHVADLLTVGSSYVKKWIPYLKDKNISLTVSVNCVDRDQGGEGYLKEAGVTDVLHLCKIDEVFFHQAKEVRAISEKQYESILVFFRDQFSSMQQYLRTHPDFIVAALQADKKTRERIRLTLDQDVYHLGQEFISQFKKYFL